MDDQCILIFDRYLFNEIDKDVLKSAGTLAAGSLVGVGAGYLRRKHCQKKYPDDVKKQHKCFWYKKVE